jgi:hypothetical protein
MDPVQHLPGSNAKTCQTSVLLKMFTSPTSRAPRHGVTPDGSGGGDGRGIPRLLPLPRDLSWTLAGPASGETELPPQWEDGCGTCSWAASAGQA